MTKGELIQALKPFTDEIEIILAIADNEKEILKIPITEIKYVYKGGDTAARIVLK